MLVAVDTVAVATVVNAVVMVLYLPLTYIWSICTVNHL